MRKQSAKAPVIRRKLDDPGAQGGHADNVFITSKSAK